MSVVQFTAEEAATPYGTTQRDLVELVSLVPIQIAGLVQCRVDEEDCKGEPCLPIDVFEGDFNAFLFKFAASQSGALVVDDYRLEKLNIDVWEEVITGNLDNTLGIESGEKFTFGTFEPQPLYSGFRVDWEKIYNLFGSGTYRFKVYNIFDVAKPSLSPPFVLQQDNCDLKDGTSYIELNQTGIINNFDFDGSNFKDWDLKGINWIDSNRYPSRLLPLSIETESIYNLYGNKENVLHRSEDVQLYDFIIFKSTWEYYKRLFNYGLVGQRIKITDDNKDSPYNFKELLVIRDGENNFEKFVNNRKIFEITIKLKESFDKGFHH